VVNVWDVASGEPLKSFATDGTGVLDVSISHDTSSIAWASDGAGPAVCPLASSESFAQPLPDAPDACCVAFAPSQPLLAWGPVRKRAEDGSTTLLVFVTRAAASS
jgi:hypothetical protein